MAAPAGWYVDPQNPQLMRYFDGENWTTQTRPGEQAAPAADASQGPTTQQAWQGQAQTQQGQNGAGVSYQHPGRTSPAQEQPGQVSGYSQPAGYGKPNQQAAQQPAQQPSAFQFGGGQQIPTADRPTTGTPRGVKLAIAGAAVGIVAFMGIGMALSDDSVEGGLDASDLGLPSDFGCDDLASEAIALSETDIASSQVISTSDLSESTNNFGNVAIPDEDSDRNLVLACKGDAIWGDGSETSITLHLTVDPASELYVEYGEF